MCDLFYNKLFNLTSLFLLKEIEFFFLCDGQRWYWITTYPSTSTFINLSEYSVNFVFSGIFQTLKAKMKKECLKVTRSIKKMGLLIVISKELSLRNEPWKECIIIALPIEWKTIEYLNVFFIWKARFIQGDRSWAQVNWIGKLTWKQYNALILTVLP